MHGALGFVCLGVAGLGPTYFRGVQRFLQRQGNRTYAWKVPNVGATVEQRAEILLRHLRDHEDIAPFNLITHSMGGLDARCLISSLGGGDLVASLTTVATPHHGSEAAEWRNRVLNRLGVLPLLRRCRSRHSEVMEIFTREWSEHFDEANPEVPHVRYRCWAGEARWSTVCPLLMPIMPKLTRREGANDGLVSVKSATLRPELLAGVIPADHFAQLGWRMGLNRFDKFNHLDFYRTIVQDLIDAGL